MKKLLLLSALFIFACSSDDGSDEQNDSIIETCNDNFVTQFMICHFDEQGIDSNKVDVFYENNSISSINEYSCQDCSPDNCEIEENSWVNELIQSANCEDYPVTTSGQNIFNYNQNGNLIYSSNNLFERYYTWENSNLVRVESFIEGVLKFEVTLNYGQILNKSKLFPVAEWADLGITIWFPVEWPIYGRNSQNLVSDWEYKIYDENNSELYSVVNTVITDYILDNEGRVLSAYFMSDGVDVTNGVAVENWSSTLQFSYD
jgi:hypothetical protein